ncbi:glycogen debranching protein GlgX [Aestuariibacter sp. AA17]|uniref:Glycogen debranching protein GlgX n=1 Tax=Fluctibacter corallii TaxID=2984329 RepID=A0ABT3A6D9_9ALTE|nr:glycogen debranching protein GlgX [Aestuariibacter sp. AA17]MCV2884245.1 glycogen debranching protein GlgX [Aestuariibacter sp. AA17]
MGTQAFNVSRDGSPFPLGSTPEQSGTNFAVYCPHAESVELCFFRSETEEFIGSVMLPAKTGKVWHGFVEGVQVGQLYGYRTHGKSLPEMGLHFHPQKLLIDPYTVCLNRPLVWNDRQYKNDSQFMMAKSVVVDLSGIKDKDPESRPKIPASQTLIYEAHVKGLTALHPDVPDALRGKYKGAASSAIISHLNALGVTTIQFMPVMSFMPEPFIVNKGLTNYWGYNPVNFFAPESRYAIVNPITEFREMVDAYHNAGIEVIIDVVFNHTAEAGANGPVLSFKGFDNTSSYLFAKSEYGVMDYQHYLNNSGCGNSLNMSSPFILTLIMDALRFWVSKMGVDGFRFDLAGSLGRDPYEFSSQSGFFKAIRQDPILRSVKLIAEPWDIGHGGYRLGQFPSNWFECNDKYRDTIRHFWRGDKGMTGDFATRILGSRDIFPKGSRHIHSSINFVTYHDGFTLQDLVQYEQKHNDANKENNQDGHNHNISANYGVEGLTSDTRILALREKQKRNLFATLLLSQGIPHMLAGDELSRTQQGNNNAYCQDNDINYLDWDLNDTQEDFLAFCRHVIALRKAKQLLRNMSLPDDHYFKGHNVAAVNWFKMDGAKKIPQDWQDPENQAFAVEIIGCHRCDNEHLLIVFNAFDNDVRFQLPDLSSGCWQLRLDTRYKKITDMPEVKTHGFFLQAYRSITLFERVTG